MTTESLSNLRIEIFHRIMGVILEETQLLRRCSNIDYDRLKRRKAHLVVELERGRAMNLHSIDTIESIQLLKKAITENCLVAVARIAAIRRLAYIVSSAQVDAESDGTYSRSPKLVR